MSLTPAQVDMARSLQTVPVPDEVARVRGCTCSGGVAFHMTGCAIFAMPQADYVRAVADATARMCAFSAELTAACRAAMTP